MHLITVKSIDHTAPCFFQALRPVNIILLMTANPAIGKDAAEFFKNMSIGNLAGQYDYLIVSPTSLKQKILYLMDEEIKKGSNGRIIMKMNSVTDVDFIQKVSEASRSGVKVDLIVRGICCILPGVTGYTEMSV